MAAKAKPPLSDSARNLAAAKAAGASIATATGVAVGLQSEKGAVSARIEAAMTAAVAKAQAEGVTDPGEMRARIMAARDDARNAGG